MSAKKQGRRTRKRAIRSIDEIALLLSNVESEPVACLRALQEPLARLSMAIAIFEAAESADAVEVGPLRTVKNQLRPLMQLVSERNVTAPPFSPDFRQRLGYSLGVLAAMRTRLGASSARLKTKPILTLATSHFVDFSERWSCFRSDPTLTNLQNLNESCRHLGLIYSCIGIANSEHRFKGHLALCELLEKALDREGTLSDVPALMRKITTAANQLARPTQAEHRDWLRTQIG
ncbi:MAG: hypothetical protein HKN03_10825 [Acidimicrobiales bacterium]|nr:hypothetical protein [Acidimicrobiales bacterium]